VIVLDLHLAGTLTQSVLCLKQLSWDRCLCMCSQAAVRPLLASKSAGTILPVQAHAEVSVYSAASERMQV
jgi:hypothetical protein